MCYFDYVIDIFYVLSDFIKIFSESEEYFEEFLDEIMMLIRQVIFELLWKCSDALKRIRHGAAEDSVFRSSRWLN